MEESRRRASPVTWASIRAAFRHWRRALRDRPTRIYTIVALVLALSLLLAALTWHTLFYFGVVATPLAPALTPWHDDAIPEYVEALLTLLGAGFLFGAWRRSGDGLLAAWAALLLVMAADNRLRLHETVGHTLAPALDPLSIGPIQGRHLGELVFWALGGLVLIILFVVGARSRTRLGVDASIILSILLIVLLHFAAGYDLLHAITTSNLVGFIEDGGEFVCIALISSYSLAVLRTAPTRVT